MDGGLPPLGGRLRLLGAKVHEVRGRGSDARAGQPRARGALLVLPVGDALQEPFWPEGLGVNRGCHNALDAAWVANKWGLGGASEEAQRQLLQERQYIYQEFSLQMHGKNRKMLKGYRQDNTKARLVALPRGCDPPSPCYPHLIPHHH